MNQIHRHKSINDSRINADSPMEYWDFYVRTGERWLMMSLTHGLVSRGYRRRVVQHQNLRLKLPGGLWHQLRGNHYHSFPYRRTLDLREKNKQESQIYNFFFSNVAEKMIFFFLLFYQSVRHKPFSGKMTPSVPHEPPSLASSYGGWIWLRWGRMNPVDLGLTAECRSVVSIHVT